MTAGVPWPSPGSSVKHPRPVGQWPLRLSCASAQVPCVISQTSEKPTRFTWASYACILPIKLTDLTEVVTCLPGMLLRTLHQFVSILRGHWLARVLSKKEEKRVPSRAFRLNGLLSELCRAGLAQKMTAGSTHAGLGT